ncbi:MAG: thiaminase II [Thermonemataceae bacterium]
MLWSEKAWQASESIYQQITAHPFIKELMTGSLPEEKFLFYLRQDALYLADYGKILASIATKLTEPAETEAFLYFANDTIQVEKALHEQFLSAYPQEIVSHSPSCLLYIGHLNRICHLKPIEEALAAILPCFWIYKEVGDYILAHQTKGNHPYQNWINTYAGEAFATAVQKAIEISNRYAKSASEQVQQAMTATFVRSSKMEWLFWDSAYHLEKWKI